MTLEEKWNSWLTEESVSKLSIKLGEKYNQYGSAAILSVVFIRWLKKSDTNVGKNDIERIRELALGNYTKSKKSINKNCPKETFLGLFFCGHIKGIEKFENHYNSQNYLYAKKAIELLKEKPKDDWLKTFNSHSSLKKYLWQTIMKRLFDNPNKLQNAQLDIVLTLYYNNIIEL